VRVVAVSMVKNEADIVEAFCRHTAAFADHHLIFDHASTDGTPFLLRRLQRDGLPLTLFTDNHVEVWQARRTTELMRRAVRDFAADWVVPLDADEFPQAAGASTFRNLLAAAPPGRVLRYPLTNYAPHPADDPAEANPVRRLRHRLAAPPDTVKVIVPRSLAVSPAAALGEGNHLAALNGTELPADPFDAWLAHFPTRTPAQTLVKVVQWELQRRAGGHPPGMLGQYRAILARVAGNPGATLRDPYFYLRGADPAPAAYWGGAVRFAPPLADWEWAAACLVPFAERLADSHGALARAARPGRLKRWWNRLRREPLPGLAFAEGVPVPDSRSADRLAAEVRVLGFDGRTAEVAVRNTGLCVWLRRTADGAGVVHLGAQLAADGSVFAPDFLRIPLPADVDPGEAVTLSATLPDLPAGATAVRFAVVSEGVRWFGAAAEVPVARRQAA
jgi:hypothetical protein